MVTSKEGGRIWSRLQKDIFADVRSGTGHTVVVARAGCGKTTTLVESVRYLPHGTRSVMFAFNKAIAKELEGRVPEGVSVSTLHSYGNRALYRAFGKLPIAENKSFDLAGEVIVPSKETWDLRRAVARAVSLAKGALASSREAIDALVDAFGIEEAGRSPGERGFFLDCVEHVIRRSKATNDKGRLVVTAIDFDDMIWLPIVLDLRLTAFDRVFIDETQDLNACQLELALRACRPGGRILAIGDDKQAIYRFRGADEDAIRRVIMRLSAKVLPLSVTYRCARDIVEVARRYVPELTAHEGNAQGSVNDVGTAEMMRLVQPGDFILSRTNAPLVKICLDLVLEGRRANIQGRDMGEALAAIVRRSKVKTIPDLLAYVEMWEGAEVERLEKANRPIDVVSDKASCIRALAVSTSGVPALLAQIAELFEDREDSTRVVLSTTHKAKGLERDRVFVLADTYLRGRKVRGQEKYEPPTQEEKNLYYVAVTRAKRELLLVRGESK